MISLEVFKILSKSPKINIELGCILDIFIILKDMIQSNMNLDIQQLACHLSMLLLGVNNLNSRKVNDRTNILNALSMFMGEILNLFYHATLVVY